MSLEWFRFFKQPNYKCWQEFREIKLIGFNEPAHFSVFFKKHTQLSPSTFKKKEIIP